MSSAQHAQLCYSAETPVNQCVLTSFCNSAVQWVARATGGAAVAGFLTWSCQSLVSSKRVKTWISLFSLWQTWQRPTVEPNSFAQNIIDSTLKIYISAWCSVLLKLIIVYYLWKKRSREVRSRDKKKCKISICPTPFIATPPFPVTSVKFGCMVSR